VIYTEYVDVAVDTVLADHYELAFMRNHELQEMLQTSGLQPVEGSFTMVNMSHACLTIPWRIVNAISLRPRTDKPDELWEIVWTRKQGVLYQKKRTH